jgi:parallel beta-helix repeat protein
MKIRRHSLLRALPALAALHTPFATGFAQGSLTPPGPPAPTMLTLAQMEPRTPVSSLPITITQPGSYFLTTNLTGVSGASGITIATNDVTLDLRGFTLLGPPAGGGTNGISVPSAQTNVSVFNGALASWTGAGVGAAGVFCSRFERLRASNCGQGLVVGNNCSVQDCTAGGNLGNGIAAGYGSLVRDCAAGGNFGNGFYVGNNGVVISCSATENNLDGVAVATTCTVKDCTAAGNGGAGISTQGGCTVKDCTAGNNDDDGIAAYGDNNLIVGNNCSGNGFGMVFGGAQNRVDDNLAGFNSFNGIFLVQTNVGNLIIRNSAPGNGSGGYYNYAGNNDYAPVQTPASATSPWANF